MLDDFFTRALVAGIGVALVAGPLGCFIIWRRMAYFGDTLSHSALLGVSVALLLQINIILAVFALSALISLMFLALQKRGNLSSDSVLGIMSHSALALGLIAISFLGTVQIDLNGLLFGDILAVSKTGIAIIFMGGFAVLAVLIWIWKPLFATVVNEELAAAEGMNPARNNLIFMLLMACVIAISIKIVGVLLITALLIIPAAAARRLVIAPEQMAIGAALLGVLSVWGGLNASLSFDTPSGPSIVVAALILFLLTLSPLSKGIKSLLTRKADA